MSPLLLALLAALLVPLFVGTWRASLFGLALQGAILAVIGCSGLHPGGHASSGLTLVDLGLVRGLLVPVGLYRVMRAQRAPARNDTIAPNLFTWALVLGMVLAAFNLSEMLVGEAGEEQTLVAISIAGVLLGFLVLASARGPFSQVIGVLRIENAIAMLELSSAHRAPLALQLALLALFVATVALFGWYLVALEPSSAAAERDSAPDSPTL